MNCGLGTTYLLAGHSNNNYLPHSELAMSAHCVEDRCQMLACLLIGWRLRQLAEIPYSSVLLSPIVNSFLDVAEEENANNFIHIQESNE